MLRWAALAITRACCRAAERCVCNSVGCVGSLIKKSVDCEPLASLYYYSGIHRHRAFNLLVEICAIEGAFVRQQTVVELIVGDQKVAMTALPTDPNGMIESVGSRGSVFISQRDCEVQLAFYRKHLVTKKHIATMKFDVDRDILSAGLPKSKWFILRVESRAVGRVKLSFHRIDANKSVVDCLVLQQSLLCMQDYRDEGKQVEIDLSGDGLLLYHEKLHLFSFALEGPLIAKEECASEMRYYKVMLVDGAWRWCYWSSKADCRSGRRPQGSAAILAISTVIRHPTNYTSFYVKHYTRERSHDVILKAVDRSRDIWTDALFLFIAETRRYLEHFENFDAYERHCMV
ncbi:hypothetical protein, conserved [Babesia bigemina]|uniref:CERLI1-like PH domain-containing protein n=1 Tax=Babesia bigemina TaxID=5866 RepID=A0A061DCT5_BABBI|nr:hypothetical protein, conserved [Babesia bigemina]CDR95755.1 hypothetical protein, conserved [Babesia bigemina]|eukprot:XP_012767941.1 hypothetical protein, conserved [Babesia bigemina]